MSKYDIETAELNYFLDLFVHLNNGSFVMFEKARIRSGDSIDFIIVAMDEALKNLKIDAEEGNLTPKQLVDLAELQRIYREICIVSEKNPEYGKIKLQTHSFDGKTLKPDGTPFSSDWVQAAVFTDSDNNVYFAARGTGIGRWVDNAVMMYEPESPMQRETREYFDLELFIEKLTKKVV